MRLAKEGDRAAVERLVHDAYTPWEGGVLLVDNVAVRPESHGQGIGPARP